VNLVQEELATITALAELHRRRHESSGAREILDQIWELAERGPCPTLHADALNVLAQIERDEGNTKAAIAAATKAYTLAWCDGPPYAYHYGLTNARKCIFRNSARPNRSFRPSMNLNFEPMPDVELNPKDEFLGGPGRIGFAELRNREWREFPKVLNRRAAEGFAEATESSLPLRSSAEILSVLCG
jgi:hypothetical protein